MSPVEREDDPGPRQVEASVTRAPRLSATAVDASPFLEHNALRLGSPYPYSASTPVQTAYSILEIFKTLPHQDWLQLKHSPV